MTTTCKNCPLRRKNLFTDMTENEVNFMQRFKAGELTIEPGTPILMEGSNAPQLYTVLEGLGIRDTSLSNGRRQVISFVFPGDFIGLQAGILGEMGHSVEARTKMKLCVFDRSEFWSFFRAHPSRAGDITWRAAVEEHCLGETVATIGQRSATEAIAWALMKIFQRGQALDMVQNATMDLPYRQQDLADALGLSLVHTNKTLGKLKQRQLASWSDGILQINDLNSLAKVALTQVSDPGVRPLM